MVLKSCLKFVIFLYFASVICLNDPCSNNITPKNLQDCLNTNTTYYNSICCLRKIKHIDGDQLSCYPANQANSTTTVKYYYNGVSGELTCSSSIFLSLSASLSLILILI